MTQIISAKFYRNHLTEWITSMKNINNKTFNLPIDYSDAFFESTITLDKYQKALQYHGKSTVEGDYLHDHMESSSEKIILSDNNQLLYTKKQADDTVYVDLKTIANDKTVLLSEIIEDDLPNNQEDIYLRAVAQLNVIDQKNHQVENYTFYEDQRGGDKDLGNLGRVAILGQKFSVDTNIDNQIIGRQKKLRNSKIKKILNINEARKLVDLLPISGSQH